MSSLGALVGGGAGLASLISRASRRRVRVDIDWENFSVIELVWAVTIPVTDETVLTDLWECSESLELVLVRILGGPRAQAFGTLLSEEALDVSEEIDLFAERARRER